MASKRPDFLSTKEEICHADYALVCTCSKSVMLGLACQAIWVRQKLHDKSGILPVRDHISAFDKMELAILEHSDMICIRRSFAAVSEEFANGDLVLEEGSNALYFFGTEGNGMLGSSGMLKNADLQAQHQHAPSLKPKSAVEI